VISVDKSLIWGAKDQKLLRYNSDFAGSLVEGVNIGAVVRSAPAIGLEVFDDDREPKRTVFLASTSGTILSLDKESNIEWSSVISSRSLTSPALDCARDSAGNVVNKPGTLYVGSEDGKLYAIMVDSQGIDTAAPWSKFHRDPRNTANGDTALNSFSCKEHYGRFLE
jgi:hypothetical protein